MRKISVQAEDFDLATELALHRQCAGDLGAVVTFTGLCRSDGGTLQALELEHFSGMAEEEIGRVVEEAEARWPLLGLTVIHRFGRIAVGEQIVLVITVMRIAASSIQDSFYPVWLQQIGLPATQIGLLITVSSAIAAASSRNGVRSVSGTRARKPVSTDPAVPGSAALAAPVPIRR